MRVGITLPQFKDSAEPAIATAKQAEDAGLDGVFVFDHLWPLGNRERPILQSTTLLGALSTETTRITLGPLVARVSVLPEPVLVNTLTTLHRMLDPVTRAAGASRRFVAAIGTGDSGNRAENEAYGVAFGSVRERVAAAISCARELRARGVHTWLGGLSRAIRRAAAQEADGWNGWGLSDPAAYAASAAEVRDLGPGTELTWGGQVLVGRTSQELEEKLERHGSRDGLVAGTVDDLVDHMHALADAGALWAICAPLDIGADADAVELMAEVAWRCR